MPAAGEGRDVRMRHWTMGVLAGAGVIPAGTAFAAADGSGLVAEAMRFSLSVALVFASDAIGYWLARLRSRGQLTELRAVDLRFTPPEAREFLTRVMGLELTATDVDNAAGFKPEAFTGSKGSFSIDAAGNWTFTANSALSSVNHQVA